MSSLSGQLFTLVFLLSSIYSASLLGKESQITFATDPWCPYICDVDSEQPGILVEATRKILQDHNIEAKFIKMNWARSIKEVRKGNIDALVGTYISDAPDFIYGDEGFLLSQMCFYIPKKDAWVYSGLLSLDARTIAFINAYSYGALFDNYILNNETTGELNLIRVTGADVHDKRLSLMERDLIDTIIDDIHVLPHLIQLQKPNFQLKNAGCLKGENVHVGFSPRKLLSKANAVLLSEGLLKLKQTGEFEMIRSKYLKDDEKPHRRGSPFDKLVLPK